MTKLEQLAGEIALLAPLKRNRNSYSAHIPWSVVENIRAELDRRQINWRMMRKTIYQKETV